MSLLRHEAHVILPDGKRLNFIVAASAIDTAENHHGRYWFLWAMVKCRIPSRYERAILSTTRHPVVARWAQAIARTLRWDRKFSYPEIAGVMGRTSHSPMHAWVNGGDDE